MEALKGLGNAVVALPGKLVDAVSVAISTPDSIIKYVVIGAVLLDLNSGGSQVESLLKSGADNALAIAVAALAYSVVKK